MHAEPRERWMQEVFGDIDPASYAGEGFTATDEIARAGDIQDPWVRARVGHEEEYWPETMPRKKGHRSTP